MTRDNAWFDLVYQTTYDPVVRYGYRRLLDHHAAEELAQEVFAIAWRRRRQVPEHALPWLYGVARRLLANEWRARRARPVALDLLEADLPLVAARDDEIATALDLRRAMARLAERDREILSLIGWEQLSLAETARVLGCTTMTASVRLFRARRRLLDVLATTVEGDPIACR